MKLGKRPPKRDGRNFKLSKYLRAGLEPPPAKVDHFTKVSTWPMYGNDIYGSCGPAGAGHQIQSWSYYALDPLTPTRFNVLDFYFELTGGEDTGVYLLEMLRKLRNDGLAGDKIEAFIETDPSRLDEAKLSIYLFGSQGVGLALPDENTFGPWLEPTGPPNPWNGHYVPIVGYDDAARLFYVVTWGELVPMSYDWYLKYVDEAYAELNDLALIKETMVTPEGFDFATLEADLQHLSDPVTPPTPDPDPDPDPEPTPDPDKPFPWMHVIMSVGITAFLIFLLLYLL